MYDSNAIDDIAYLTGKQEQRERETESEGGSSDGGFVPGMKPKGATAYRDQDSERGGEIWRPNLSLTTLNLICTPEDGKPARVGRGRRFAEGLATGQVMSAKNARKLSQGFDPVTNERLMPHNCAFHEKFNRYPEKMKGKKKPTAGYDNTNSGVEKDLSAIWADLKIAGDEKTARAIEDAVMAATHRASQYMLDNGIVKGRKVTKGPDGKKVETLVPMIDFVTADYLHCTNRNSEPQLHVHSLMFNMGVREDGTVGAINNTDIVYMRPVLDAVFKTELYHQLRQIEGFADIEIIKGEKGIRIGGVKQELVDAFSTRTQEIDEYLEARGMDTQDRRNRELAAKASRKSKDDAPPIAQLIGHWEKVITEHTDGQGIRAGLTKREVIEETRDQKMLRLGQETVVRLKLNLQTMVDERDVLAASYRAAIGELSPDEVPELIKLVKSQFLVDGEYDRDGRATWGIKELVLREVSFMRMVANMESVAPMATEAQIAAILKRNGPDPEKGKPGLNEEQAAGIRYMLSSTDPLTLFNGAAGTGKTFSMALVKQVAEESGFTVHGIAPAHKAAGILRDELQLREELSTACAKWIARHKTGKLEINSKTVVVIDEGGMMGIEEAEYIVRAVRAEGGRVIMLGDIHQLSPVAAGSPMALAMRLTGAHRLNIVMRQRDNTNEETKRLTARMREASSLFVMAGENVSKSRKGEKGDDEAKASNAKINPNIYRALSIYNDEGRILWCDDASRTYHSVADQYTKDLAIEKDPKEVMVITNRNSCVHAINKEIRTSMIEQGLLGTSEIAFQAYTRNNKEDEVGFRLKLRAGDRVIFGGKQLESDQTGLPFTISNSEMATIRDVIPGKNGEEPTIAIEFDKRKGEVYHLKPSQLVPYSSHEDRKPLPVLQHAYCVTVHASQGATVNRAIVADVYGMDYRLAYVGMTRHRKDVRMFVNVGRMEDNKLAKAGIIVRMEDGKLAFPHKDKDVQVVEPEDFKMGPEEYFEYLAYEASITDDKRNFVDQEIYRDPEALKAALARDDTGLFYEHVKLLQKKYEGEGEMLKQRILDNSKRKNGSLASDRDTVKPIEGKENPFRDVRAPSIEPDMEALKSTGGREMDQELRQAVAQRIQRIKPPVKAVEAARQVASGIPVQQGDVGRSKPAAPAPEQKVELRKSGLITEAEREEFKRRDPIQLMLAKGAVLDPNKSGRNDMVNFCDGIDKSKQPYNRYTMMRRDNGIWTWKQWNTPGMGGTIEHWLVKKGHAKSYPDAWHQLRGAFGTEHLRNTHVAANPVIEKPKPTYETYRDTVASQLASTGFPGSGKAEERLQAAIDLVKEKEAAAKANPDDKHIGPTNIDRVKAATAVKMLEEIAKGEAPTANKFEQKRAADVRKLVEDGKSVHEYRFKYGMQPPWVSDQYPKQRGIERATILRFEHDVKRDVVKDQKTGEWKAGLAFAHRDVIKFGTITGIESKRPVALASNGEAMATTKFTDGEGKGLGMIGNKMRGDKGPVTIVAAESGIDALSWWQETKLPADFKSKSDEQKLAIAKAVPDDTLMLSVAGTASQHALQGIELIAKNNPQAKWVIAPDNDFAGQAIRDNIQAAILKGNKNAQIEIQAPSNIVHKDWNDHIRDVIRTPEDLQKEADRMKLSVTTVAQHVDRYQASHPDRDLSAYRGVGSKEAEASEQKAAIDMIMKASDKEIREQLSKIDIKILGPSRRDSARDGEAEKAAAEAAKRRQEEEDRQKQRGAVQRM